MLNDENNNIKPENEQNLLTETDLKRAGLITESFVEKVETTSPVRIGTTADEKKGAMKIRDLFNKILGVPARTEPFSVYPFAGRFGIPIFGVAYGVALAFYIVGVLLDEVAASNSFLITSLFVTLVVFAVGFVQVILNKNIFNRFFPRKTSYNVLSTIESKKDTECTLILGGHYDSDMDRSDFVMFLKDKNLPKWLSKMLKILSIVSAPTMMILAVVSMCIPSRDAGLKAFLFLFPTIFSGCAIFYLVTYFSYKKRNSTIGHDGLQAGGLSLAVADYLRTHPDVVPDNCRIILANFGAKECGAKGSEQFILQHYGHDKLLINPVFLNIAEVTDIEQHMVIQGDGQYKHIYDLKVNNIAFNALKTAGLDPVFQYNHALFTDSTPFAKHSIPTTTLILKKGDNELVHAYDDAFKGALSATIATMNYMHERQQAFRGLKEIEE